MFEEQQNCLRQVIGLITYILSLWCVVDIIQLILQKCAFQYKYFLCMKEDFVLCNFPELMLLILTIWLTCLLLKNISIWKKIGCYVAIENKNYNLIITWLNVNRQNTLFLLGHDWQIIEQPTICKHKIDAFFAFVVQCHAFQAYDIKTKYIQIAKFVLP